MNKPIVVFSNDWHLKKENIDQITDLVRQKCELAKVIGVELLVCLGDIFESRIAQREEVLTAFSHILDIVTEYKLKLWMIPGNHDKTTYTSFDSFLTAYKDHPNFKLIDKAGGIPFKNTVDSIYLHLIPFFEEKMWNEQFELLCNYIGEDIAGGKHILCTHIAVTGSKNNDGEFVSSEISTKQFSAFFKVFSGHYHDQQKIGNNFYHLPSIQQNNFGEDIDKGFTVLYSDGSHKLVQSKFKKYIKVKVDLDRVSLQEAFKLTQHFKGSEDNIRFEFIGSDSVLKSLNKEDFILLGIDVKTKSREIEDDIIFSETEEVVEHTKESIKVKFVDFCEKEKLNKETGFKFLNKKL